MPVLTASIFQVTLPTGNKAVYGLPPDKAQPLPGTTMSQQCLLFGTQLAHHFNGRWFKPKGWIEITDPQRVALLERVPAADVEA